MKNKFLHKHFYLNAWTVGYRPIEDGLTDIPSSENRAHYRLVPISDHVYYADPFVFEDDDKIYLFVESLNRYRGKATLSVSMFENNRFGEFIEILREPFHLSYPNVFRYKNSYYMIPETSEINQIRLYRAVVFPYRWELCKVLLDNGNKYTDNSIEIKDDEIFFYAYYEADGKGITERYILDFDSMSLVLSDEKPTLINQRPAGNPINVHDHVYRPVQDCEEYYGKAIELLCHNELKAECYGHRIDDSCYNISQKHITGTHTINRSRRIEVVDIRFDRFCFTRRWIWLINKIRNH